MVKIRTKEYCPICRQKFTHIQKLGFICAQHKTIPRKYYLDFSWKGRRIRLFSDQYGKPLDSYNRALVLKSRIETESENHQFDPSRYVGADLKDYIFETRIDAWFGSKMIRVEDGELAQSYTSRLKIYIDRYYMPFFRGRDVREIRTIDIKKFQETLSDHAKDQLKKLSPKYKRNIIDALENFFNIQVQEEVIKDKPVFIKDTIAKPKTRWCRRALQDSIISAVPDAHRPIFFLLTRQGIRPGEAVALQWRDIDMTAGTVLIRRTESLRKIKEQTKGKVETYRLLHPDLLLMLKTFPPRFPKDYIFLNVNTGRPYRVNNLEGIWNKACAKVGVDNITLYEGTRHSVASQAATRGVSLFKIGEVLGHSDKRTTERYAKMDVSDQIEVFESPSPAAVTKLSPSTKQSDK